VREFLDPRGKRPPSAAYLLFYGGSGLLLLSLLFNGKPAWLIRPTIRWTGVIGRASLVVFVLQDWLFFGVPKVLALESIGAPAFWLLYLLACTAVLYAFASAWGRMQGNRFLSVGLIRVAHGRSDSDEQIKVQ
jgi:hypothetical protein